MNVMGYLVTPKRMEIIQHAPTCLNCHYCMLDYTVIEKPDGTIRIAKVRGEYIRCPVIAGILKYGRSTNKPPRVHIDFASVCPFFTPKL